MCLVEVQLFFIMAAIKTFIFDKSHTDNINRQNLVEFKRAYWNSLDENPFPLPPEKGKAIEMIRYFKRKEVGTVNNIGPYKGITVLEAANRIASDLVIINGILQVVDSNKELEQLPITLRLGNRHEKGRGDFSIGKHEGEAFNVAPSFYNVKLSATRRKWHGNDLLKYILVNAEVVSVSKVDDPRIIGVEGWDKQ